MNGKRTLALLEKWERGDSLTDPEMAALFINIQEVAFFLKSDAPVMAGHYRQVAMNLSSCLTARGIKHEFAT